jgi:hypothetical protein
LPATTAAADNQPPYPRLTLTFGVIGHRPNRLPKAADDPIKSQIERVITLIKHEVGVVHRRYEAYFSKDAPQLCLVSALAEGADRIVAEAALARGFVLDAPIPFLRDEYARDFAATAAHDAAGSRTMPAPNSPLEEFNRLTADNVV